jgi:hypothetical protein
LPPGDQCKRPVCNRKIWKRRSILASALSYDNYRIFAQ